MFSPQSVIRHAPSISLVVMLLICSGVFLLRSGRPELLETAAPLAVLLAVVELTPDSLARRLRNERPPGEGA